MKHSPILSALIGLVMATVVNGSDLRLHEYFTDNMVLQQLKPTVLTGWASAATKIRVSIGAQTKTATADAAGKWTVTLDPMPATTTPLELSVQAQGEAKTLTIRNILVGDVWFFGRQAYVDISLSSTAEGQAAAAALKPHRTFRSIVIKTMPAREQQDDLDKDASAGWMQVDRQQALKMSGAAFYLGQNLTTTEDVPIGMVDVNMDRYFGIGWLSPKALADSETMNPKDKEISWLPKYMREKDDAWVSGQAQKDLDEYFAAAVARNPHAIKPSLGLAPIRNPMFPSAGYNAVIYPLRGIAFKGALLQLGNDYPFIAYREIEKAGTSTEKAALDAAWGDNYMILKNGYRVTPVTLPYVPADWRRTWQDETLPIGLVLPPSSDLDVYAAHNREIRELHRRTAEASEGIGLILPGMGNIPQSGQPADQKLLAQRCLKWIEGAVDNKKNAPPTGPLFGHLDAHLSKATIYFKKGTAEGLKAKGDALDHFETAGPDREFSPAQASIDGTTIKLKSHGPIQFVRYNWMDNPGQGLVNAADLPAIPFSTDADWTFGWIPPPEQPDLPPEYTTTADKWGKSDVAIINGQIASLASGDSEPIPRRPGPIGIYSSPFGPNIYVISTDPDTPADGLLLPGDIIYGVNGKVFTDGEDVPGDQQYHDLSAAITYSESDEGQGKLVLSIRRGTKLMDVDLKLEVLGSYSSTTPYYCEKSETIVRRAEAWLANQYRPSSGLASEPHGMLHTDLLFLLASGTPEQQGLVRRAVYSMMKSMTPLKPAIPGSRASNWHLGHNGLLLGEYFHATGDRNVLPYLKNLNEWMAMTQLKPEAETPEGYEAAHAEDVIGGWRHNYPTGADRWQSGYGLLPHAGMSCVMSMLLAKEAGVDIDELALQRGLTHFHKGRAEYGFVLYSYSGVRRNGPAAIDPEAEANGNLSSMNGKLGMAAALFNMVEGEQDTVEICSRYCVYGYNRTRSGHGGMFFNNFWTPIGAWASGEKGFKHFMKHQTWWRELYRRSDGSFNQVGRGHIGVGYALAYVAPKQRLRILGSPVSAFGPNPPPYLKPALAAHRKRDYARCEKMILEQLDGALPAEDLPVVNQLLESVQTLRASIANDLALTQALIADGKYYYASLELPQLEGVVAPNDPQLKAIKAALESPEGKQKINKDRSACEREQDAQDRAKKRPADVQRKGQWVGLVKKTRGTSLGDTWKLRLVENISQAPNGWVDPGYDDSAWYDTKLPTSWCMYHTALFRSTFKVQDKTAFDALRVQGEFFQQANVVIYLNGKLVAKIDNLERGTGTTDAQLTNYAMELLKDGENTIAISSRHKRRWGPYRGTYKTAATAGFEVQARKRD